MVELVPTAVRFRAEVTDPRTGTEVVYLDVAFSLASVIELDASGETPLWEAGDRPVALDFDGLEILRDDDGGSSEAMDINIPTSSGLIGIEPDEIDIG